jgi:hypothetical protein
LKQKTKGERKMEAKNLNELSKALNIPGYWEMKGNGLYVGHIAIGNEADLGLMAVFQNPGLEPVVIFENSQDCVPGWKIEKAAALLSD